ncbi:MAG: activator of HSP90 ATPase [Alphaproteobacteria bacterium]|nr:activator of HSP90 ATPase [Alphaproteobacteria bacterium]
MSANVKAGDHATVTITVAVDRAVAFDVFTRETDLWWKHGPAYRMSGRTPGTLMFEPREGGRLFESHNSPSGRQLFEYGRIKAWQPPARLVFEWRNANFAANEVTEVEVLFEEIAGGTRVTLHHRGWASLRPGHPARHNLEPAGFSRMIGMWWADLLTSYRSRIG